MKKRIAAMLMTAALAVSCAASAFTGISKVTTYAAEAPAGVYVSEVNGTPARTAVQAQRPIAVMIDNDKAALPHYGLAEADVVYELMNSTANRRITRLMAIYKNWDQVARIGSIRSTRPTNILLAEEWDAVLIHDGGPFYNNPYFAVPYAPAHLSGGFPRIANGKAYEFTEYVLNANLIQRMASSGTPTTYQKAVGNHFIFGTNDMVSKGGIPIVVAALPFANTSSQLRYNAATQTYDYWEFGSPAKDGGTGLQVTFKNVILQNVTFHQYDKNGYLIYNCIGTSSGWYLCNGYAIPITWLKANELDKTHYYTADGKELVLNPGKTYISLIPDDSWSQVVFQ